MDENLASLIRTCGLRAWEVDSGILFAVAKDGGSVVPVRDGRPVAAVVSLDDLAFILDAAAAEQDDILQSGEAPPADLLARGGTEGLVTSDYWMRPRSRRICSNFSRDIGQSMRASNSGSVSPRSFRNP